MDIFEESEVSWPARSLQQDDEQAALCLSQDTLLSPLLLLNRNVRAKGSHIGIIGLRLLIVLTEPFACKFYEDLMTSAVQIVGAVITPGQSCSRIHTKPLATDSSNYIYQLDKSGSVMFLPSQCTVPDCDASDFAHALLSSLQPQQVMVLGSFKAGKLQSSTLPDSGPWTFLLQTAAAKQQKLIGKSLPELKSGSLVEGLSAALISFCEVRQIPAYMIGTMEREGGWSLADSQELCLSAALLLSDMKEVEISTQFKALCSQTKRGAVKKIDSYVYF